MIKRFLFLLVPFILASCDPGAYAIITNQSNDDTTVEIQFDEKYYRGDDESKESLKSQFERNLTFFPNQSEVINLDTIRYSAVVRLSPRDTFLLDGGLRPRPDYYVIKKLTINSKAYQGDEIENAFEKVDATRYELKIR